MLYTGYPRGTDPNDGAVHKKRSRAKEREQCKRKGAARRKRGGAKGGKGKEAAQRGGEPEQCREENGRPLLLDIAQ